ncbi:MAG TPA: hypothetical protein VHL11_10570 [Phototrophicaceae bacterium]|jgi:hypothetical protein|nr:hypothetical protein [Phototrophicaceae bacterium]
MHQPKFDEVRDLIDQQRYEEARTLLKTIDHPLTQKWQERIDEADPNALSPSEQQERRVLARDVYLKEWMRQERSIARWSGFALFAFAIYLWQFETVFWAFSPGFLVQLTPLLVIGGGAYIIWMVQDRDRLRRHILNMNPDDLRKVSLVLIPSAALLTLLTIVMGNTAQFFVAGFLISIGFINLWRANQAAALNQI